MERETLVTMLLMVFSGLALQMLASWPAALPMSADATSLERAAWLRVCLPALPTLLIAAWLIGWAVTQPDPVRDRIDPGVVTTLWVPFGLLYLRALWRAVWALLREPPECGVSTVGFMNPQVVFSPFLAKQLDERVIAAAVAHEKAHGRHRDPLRIWLAQFITDLQWPWPAAQRRLRVWLDALEWARDEQARRTGVDGADLAAAVLASVRYLEAHRLRRLRAMPACTHLAHARLIGDGPALRARIARLLAPLAQRQYGESGRVFGIPAYAMVWVPLLLVTLMLGVAYGGHLMRPLLGLSA